NAVEPNETFFVNLSLADKTNLVDAQGVGTIQNDDTPGTNNPPVATDSSETTAEDAAKSMTLHATDADGDSLTYAIDAAPTHGTLGTVSGNTVTYTPAANYNGPDSFTFHANDGTANSNISTLTVTVTEVN